MKFSIISKTGWLLLGLLISVPLFFWITYEPIGLRFENTYMGLTNLGRILGIVAMVLFCLNVILSARFRWLETVFGGLNKMFIAHHIIGSLALLTILLHPLLFSLRAMNTAPIEAAKQLVPFMNDTMTTIGILSLWLFISLMILTLYVKLPYKTWLLTHKLLGIVLIGIILHTVLGSSDINADIRLKAFAWALMGLAVISFTYRTLMPRLFVRRYDYTIDSVTTVSQGVVRVHMMPTRKAVRFTSGQFIFVSFQSEGFSHEFHPFTVSSNEAQDGLSITVKSLGKYTDTLVKLAPGMTGMQVKIEGAYGRFSFENFRSKRQVWIAGGIGITPFLSMAADVQSPYQVDLYYSVKSASEIIDGPYLQSIIDGSQGALRVIPYVADTQGFLTADAIMKYSGSLAGTDILLCGPPPMMHGLRQQLKTKGVMRSRIHSEEFAMT